MPDPAAPEVTDTEERQPLAALFGQLASDTSAFAKAEMAWLRAQAGERASYALPGIALVGVAVALSFGTLVALVVGLMMLVSAVMAPHWAILLVTTTFSLISVLLGRWGVARLRKSLKPREDR